MAEDGDDETFFKDLALSIVTLGFYMPYWLWRKNQDLVEFFPEARYAHNGWWLSGGAALAMVARAILGGSPVFDPAPHTVWDRLPPAAGAALGILAFLSGVYLFTNNLLDASRRLKVRPSDPPWWFPAALGVAFFGIELGNVFPTWWLRGPVILALLSLPYFFYRTHRDFVRVEHEVLDRYRNRPVAAAPVPKRPAGKETGHQGSHRA